MKRFHVATRLKNWGTVTQWINAESAEDAEKKIREKHRKQTVEYVSVRDETQDAARRAHNEAAEKEEQEDESTEETSG